MFNPALLLSAMAGLVLVVVGLLALAKTHGLTLAALFGWLCASSGAASFACSWTGRMPLWLVPVALVLAAVALWAVVGGRGRPPFVRRCTGFGDLD